MTTSSRFAIYTGTRIRALGRSVDGFYAEQHKVSVSKTAYPVESGASVTDHAVREPNKLKLQGWVSDLMPAPLAIPWVSRSERGAGAWLEILRVMEAREPLTVITALAVYQNMLLVSAEAPVDRTTGLSLVFTLDLEEVLVSPAVRQEGRELGSVSQGPAANRLGAVRRGRVQARPVPRPQMAQWLGDLEEFE